MSGQNNGKIGLPIFLASLCLSFMLNTIDTKASETNSGVEMATFRSVEQEPEKDRQGEILQLEFNDPTAVMKLKEYILLNDIDYQLSNRSEEEFKSDILHATITTGTLDVTKFGVQEITVTLTLDCSTEFSSMITYPITKNIKVEFVDTTGPMVELSKTTIVIAQNGTFKPEKYVKSVTDNGLSQEFDVEYIHEVDTSKLGNYEVIYKVSDQAGNITEECMTVTVSKRAVAASSASYSVSAQSSGDIQTMLDLINSERVANGVYALVLGDEAGMNAAAIRAQEAAGYLSHTRPDGSSYKTALSECGVSYGTTGEVLTVSGSSVYDKFSWWMNSSAHRNRLLSSNYTYIVIANCGGVWVAILY